MGTPDDLEKAREWFGFAAKQGDNEATQKIQEIDVLMENSLSNKMDNSLLAVRGINHKYIVIVEDVI